MILNSFSDEHILPLTKDSINPLQMGMGGQKGELGWVCWGMLQAGARGP